MLLIKLAFRNITHAGIRTWLNVIVLSFAFVLIVLIEGLYDGMSAQVKDAEIDFHIGGGQFWQKHYDPYDSFSFELSHSEIPSNLKKEISNGNASAILIISASIFPRNLIQSVSLKGIDPDQKIVSLPSSILKDESDTNAIPGFIGSRMANSTGLHTGDYVSTRWRDINGTFDAGDIKIVKVIDINVPSVDKNQIWIPLEKLRKMIHASGQATIITLNKNISRIPQGNRDWILKDHNYLLKDLNENINRKRIYSTFMFSLLLGMALLAVFDTQVLSIFRRRKEIGTLMALGMTKLSVIVLFTLEGFMLGILSFIAGSVYGFPILAYLAKEGIVLPRMIEKSQFAILVTLYPKYGLRLYIMTGILLFLSVIIVSYLPAHRITKLKPTDALKGKLS